MLYMCPSERRITKQLTDLIYGWDRSAGGLSFTDPDGSLCEGTIVDGEGKYSCEKLKDSAATILHRKVTLLTLKHV